MREYSEPFKALNGGIRKHSSNIRNNHALIVCYNISPGAEGPESYEPIINFNDETDWEGDGVYVRPPETKDVIINARDYLDNEEIVGASVTIDGIFRGLTNEEGKITVAGLEVGGHTIQIAATGYVETALDTLSNDYFTVI